MIGEQPEFCPFNTEAWCDYPACDCKGIDPSTLIEGGDSS